MGGGNLGGDAKGGGGGMGLLSGVGLCLSGFEVVYPTLGCVGLAIEIQIRHKTQQYLQTQYQEVNFTVLQIQMYE